MEGRCVGKRRNDVPSLLPRMFWFPTSSPLMPGTEAIALSSHLSYREKFILCVCAEFRLIVYVVSPLSYKRIKLV